MARREQHQFLLWVVLLLLASFAFASNASAADLHDPSGSFTGLLDLVKNSAAQWDGKLRGYAKTLFWLLASIQFVWTFMPLVFRQADFGEIVGELIRFILVIGFFYALLLFSADWADKVVDSFRTAGASAAGLGTSQIRPGDIFGTSIELANTIGDVETWNPLTATMVALAGLLVLLCFAFIAAFMGLTIIESYVVINASVLFMGFGASQWTREYALAIVRYAVSVGAKLFVLTLIVGLIVDSAKTWQAAYNHDDASMWTMVGLALVCAYLAKTIPELVAGMISGTSMGGGSAIGGMAAAGAAGAAAAIATIATAGAAAPAAAGALGAAGSAGAAGAGGIGGGGLAAAINSSFAGGSAPAAAATGGTGAASGLGASTGGQAAAKGASSAGARVGGSAAPQSPGPAPQQPSSGVQQAAKQAGKAAQGGDDDKGQQTAAGAQTPPAGNADASASSSAPSASAQSPAAQAGEGQGEAKSGVSGHQIASGITRGAGILSAIAVPGMEGAAGLSLGAGAPQPVPGSGADADGSMAPSSAPSSAEPQNVIRPAEPSPASPSDAGPAKPDTKGGE
ncbi:TPA: P-type conjugative transfer protein TrbL [Escherichia coli]|nr:P-type conjugative transfer protein TrbL [Escherichia coli]